MKTKITTLGNSDIESRRQDILIEGANSFLGTCNPMLGKDSFVLAGIVQIFGIECYDFVQSNIDRFTDMFSEDEITQAFISADISECAECGWWCDDVHHESPDTTELVCSECNENHRCGDCGEYPCEC